MTKNSGNRETGGAKALAGKFYTSEEIFARETDRIFQRNWLCVCRTAEISESGDYRLFEVGNECLIIVRDRQGEVRAHHNVCRHRGTRLLEHACGSGETMIRCPYHGWNYDLSGTLIAAPNMLDVEGFDRSDYGLVSVSVAEWEGFVFVNLDPAATPLDNAFAPILNRFQPWRLSELVSVARHEYEVRANWKLLFQNYNECYHCPRIHPRLNAMSAAATAVNDVEAGAFLGGPMQLAEGVSSMTLTGESCGEPMTDLDEQDRRRVYYYSLFPTLLLSPHPDFVLVHRIDRVDVETTCVVCEFLFPPESIARPNFDPSSAVDFWDETNLQDWHICEQSQRGVASRAYQPGPYSHPECTLAAFDRHYLDTLASIEDESPR